MRRYDCLHTSGDARHPANDTQTWLNALLDNADAVAQRGSVADTKYFLNQAEVAVKALRSSVLGARVAARFAQLQYRLRHYEASGEKLGEASTKLALVSVLSEGTRR